MSTLTANDLKSLEQARHRLFQLSSTLINLQETLHRADPLPQWSSIQSIATILAQTLSSIEEHYSHNAHLFDRIVLYPQPIFPGREQAEVLEYFLRKKPEPIAEEFTEQGQEKGQELSENAVGKELEELWSWAGEAVNAEARKRVWVDEFTVEEREAGTETVITGLRRSLEDSGDEEDDDEDGMDEAEDGTELKVVRVRRKSGAAGVEFDVSSAVGEKRENGLSIERLLRLSTIGV